MKRLDKNAWLGLLVLALAVGVVGCESDPVAPQDKLPELTGEDSARQSVIIAQALVKVGPYMYDLSKAIEDVTIVGEDVNGVVHIDFRDGPDGTPADPAVATWAHLYTDDGSPVTALYGSGGETEFDLDVMGNIYRDPDLATILEGSGGTMVSGDFTTEFAMDGVVIDGGDYPAAGIVTIDPDEGPSATVTFNGTNIARAHVGAEFFDVNLDTGAVTEVVMPI